MRFNLLPLSHLSQRSMTRNLPRRVGAARDLQVDTFVVDARARSWGFVPACCDLAVYVSGLDFSMQGERRGLWVRWRVLV